MVEILSYGLENHFKGKTFNNFEELEQEICRRLHMSIKIGKPFTHPNFKNKLMVKVDIKEEKHPKVGVEFIYVNKIEAVEL